MKTFIRRRPALLAIIGLSLYSVITWLVFYRLNLTLLYNDAMSHLDVARLVFDNQQPGLSQLGSVWLPLGHILMLPFVWNNFLWHTGLAGAIVSMVSFVIGALALYRIVMLLSGSRVGAVVGVVAFATNLNLLYLQSTPLTEPLYVALFLLTCLFTIQYVKFHSSRSIVALSLITMAGILTRYDAWFVAFVAGSIILVNELVFERQRVKIALGYFLLYLFPIVFGVGLWLGWNLLIFHDPLYAFTGPYSAHAQQAAIEASSGLITKSNALISLKAYYFAAIDNIGVFVSAVGVIGWIIYLFSRHQASAKLNLRLFAFIILGSVIVFNVIALYLGFSILNLPELNWNPSGTLAGTLFNVRYGILALPFTAVGIGLVAAYVRKLHVILIGLLVAILLLQSVALYSNGIITIQDGQYGSSSFTNSDVANVLRNDVKPGEQVLMSTSSYNAVAFESGLDLSQFIHEGVSKKWASALQVPDHYATWLVMANGEVGEPVYDNLVVGQHDRFLQKYTLAYKGAHANVYRLK